MWGTGMWNSRRMRGAQVPSTNGYSDARSLARMYAACIGEVDGVRLLSDDTVARARVPLSDGPDCVNGVRMTFGLGFMLASMFPAAVGARTFGHIGAGGSTAFDDPDRGLGFGVAMNQMEMLSMERSDALVAATYKVLD